jgi:hypothetical protein
MTTPFQRILAVTLVATAALLLAGVQQQSPREVVTHRICYTDVQGNRTCE